MRMEIKPQTIRLPHLSNYAVRIRINKPPPDVPHAVAWIERDSRFGSTIYARPGALPFAIAHEIVHLLRFICIDFNMQFEHESEHMAYLMQYILGKAYGCEWSKL